MPNELVQQRQPIRVRQYQQRELCKLTVNRNRSGICMCTDCLSVIEMMVSGEHQSSMAPCSFMP